jgi:hypothetical protein
MPKIIHSAKTSGVEVTANLDDTHSKHFYRARGKPPLVN